MLGAQANFGERTLANWYSVTAPYLRSTARISTNASAKDSKNFVVRMYAVRSCLTRCGGYMRWPESPSDSWEPSESWLVAKPARNCCQGRWSKNLETCVRECSIKSKLQGPWVSTVDFLFKLYECRPSPYQKDTNILVCLRETNSLLTIFLVPHTLPYPLEFLIHQISRRGIGTHNPYSLIPNNHTLCEAKPIYFITIYYSAYDGLTNYDACMIYLSKNKCQAMTLFFTN
jgi:hypothetical protein